MATEQAQQKQSRNGKKPVTIPKGVTVAVDGGKLTVKGSKGEVVRVLRPEVVLEQKDGTVTVAPAEGSGKFGTQYQGLTRALLQNMVTGVSEGYKVSLDFRGVGYRAEFNNGILKMTVGLSHKPAGAPDPAGRVGQGRADRHGGHEVPPRPPRVGGQGSPGSGCGAHPLAAAPRALQGQGCSLHR